MYKWLTSILIIAMLLLNVNGTTVAHAAGPVELYTPYTGISVGPGESIDYEVTLINNTGDIQDMQFSVEGLGKGWNYHITSNGLALNELSVKPGKSQTLTFQVNVPLEIEKGTYEFELKASGGGNSATLPLSLTVTEKGTSNSALEVEQANMQGDADSTFTYSATLKNQTSETQRYALSAKPEKGWSVQFEADGKKVTSVEIESGAQKTITVKLTPPNKIKEGTYKIPIGASNGQTAATQTLEAVITGSYGLQLSTPSGRLSTSITEGDTKTIELKITNTGTSKLSNIELSDTVPADWDVTFDPEKITSLKPGESKTVNAKISAADGAIAGDYVVEMSATSDKASSDAQFRVAVETSVLWGWLGILIILAVLGGLYYLFRKYGRR